ncbi:hypothetical protein ABEB36_011188 [Hypothenemus hampei]|uniref:Lipase domain-containing protein n=1 Tax=Hypothenemus hampei TaxID=57062 RepID=A0ABD1EEJ1_HYPHA
MYLSFLLVGLLAFTSADVNPQDVSYILYSRNNPNGIVSRSNEDPQALLKIFNPNLPTVVLVHGWQDNYEANSNTFVRDAIFSKTNANVVKIDWEPLSTQGYFSARDAVPSIGRLASVLLQRFSLEFGYSLANVTLVGFSLGAHVSGNIGKVLGGQIGRIIALDPAGPFISSSDIDYSLHPTDAVYVQVIHTNAGGLGMVDAVGHADFYPNGGARQPGCGLDILGSCAHNRAWEYFAESVVGNNFVATSCDSWENLQAGRCSGETVLMGGLSTLDTRATGLFFLQTNNASQYGRG